MAGGARKNPVLANPFFVALMLVSTCFVVTALGYSIVPYVFEHEAGANRPGTSVALAGWLDRNGPMVLGIEFVAMFLTGVAAMLTEDWFTKR